MSDFFKMAAVPYDAPRESGMTDDGWHLCVTLARMADFALHLFQLSLLWDRALYFKFASVSVSHGYLTNFRGVPALVLKTWEPWTEAAV